MANREVFKNKRGTYAHDRQLYLAEFTELTESCLVVISMLFGPLVSPNFTFFRCHLAPRVASPNPSRLTLVSSGFLGRPTFLGGCGTALCPIFCFSGRCLAKSASHAVERNCEATLKEISRSLRIVNHHNIYHAIKIRYRWQQKKGIDGGRNSTRTLACSLLCLSFHLSCELVFSVKKCCGRRARSKQQTRAFSSIESAAEVQ